MWARKHEAPNMMFPLQAVHTSCSLCRQYTVDAKARASREGQNAAALEADAEKDMADLMQTEARLKAQLQVRATCVSRYRRLNPEQQLDDLPASA